MAGTVTVACKLPHGLILRLFDMVEVVQPAYGGGVRTVQEARPREGRVTIGGYAAPFGKMPAFRVEGGYALTHGVDAEFFAEWMKQNERSDIVRNRLIFAFGKEHDATVEARKMESVRNGLEALDPDKPPQEFRRRRQVAEGTAYSGIETATSG